MLNKDLIFSLMVEDYMGNLYIPWLSTDFSEKEETTSLDFTLERSATMGVTKSNGRASSIELTFPDGTTETLSKTDENQGNIYKYGQIPLPAGTRVKSNKGANSYWTITLQYPIWISYPEIKSGGGHKFPVVSFLSYQLNNMVCINNEIKFKKRA